MLQTKQSSLPPSPLGKPDPDTSTLSDGVKKGSHSDRQTPHLNSPHPTEYKEDAAKGQNGMGLAVANQTAEPMPNGRLIHQHNADPGDKRKEIFSKDTLFKPPPNALVAGYVDSGYPKSGTLRKTPHMKSAEVLGGQEHFEKPAQISPSPGASAQQASEPAPSSAAEASFDYYNVSDDDDSEEAAHKNAVEEQKNREGGGTMQWLLEREKERELQPWTAAASRWTVDLTLHARGRAWPPNTSSIVESKQTAEPSPEPRTHRHQQRPVIQLPDRTGAGHQTVRETAEILKLFSFHH
ncbi:hypothetical protein SKAU_G00038730 [Synaphobranchus kaupii]|uniref:Uncharacterized protein n=1 Tax=Synaphobranchus kaupii TaxID=118154 RepID=A0A9Q1GGY1_SYNKA|nr:hypothetical protein SKAU_G00038730 [Synaphobranchus kaupii]